MDKHIFRNFIGGWIAIINGLIVVVTLGFIDIGLDFKYIFYWVKQDAKKEGLY